MSESLYISEFIIQQLYQKINQELKQKKLQKKYAPMVARKQTSHSFESFVAMQSKYLQLSDTLNNIPEKTNIDKDSLAISNIKSQIQKQKISKQPQKLVKLSNKNNSKYLKNSSFYSIKNTSKINQKQEQSNKCFSQIIRQAKLGLQKLKIQQNIQQNNDNNILEEQIEKVKNKKFFIQEKNQRDAIQNNVKIEQIKNNFNLKVNKFKKISQRFSYDYDGDTIQAKNTFVGKPVSVHEIRSSFVQQNTPKLSDARLVKIHSLTIDNKTQNQLRLSKQSNIDTNQINDIRKSSHISNNIIGKSLDPVSQINDNTLEQGIKISNANLCKQKYRKRVQNRLKTLQQFRENNKTDHFKQFTIKSNKIKEKIKTLPHEEILKNKNSEPVSLKNSKLNFQKKVSNDSMRERIKTQNVSLTNSRLKNSILFNSTIRNTKNGTITIDNTNVFEQLLCAQI